MCTNNSLEIIGRTLEEQREREAASYRKHAAILGSLSEVSKALEGSDSDAILAAWAKAKQLMV